MNAKHLSKNMLLNKFIFLLTYIMVTIISVLIFCITSTADAEPNVKSNVSLPGSITVTYMGEDLGLQEGEYADWYLPDPNPEQIYWNKNDNFLTRLKQPLYSDIVQIVAWQEEVNVEKVNKSYYCLNIMAYDDTGGTGHLMSYVKYYFMHDSTPWKLSDEDVNFGKDNAMDLSDLSSCSFYITPVGYRESVNVSGVVYDTADMWTPVYGAFVQYCQWNPWFWDYVPVTEMSTFTDWFGNYTIDGITEEMLPGVIRVYRFGYEVGESWPIWGAPEGEDTVYRFIQMAPSEPPVPPIPPDPPVPPVPPQPDPPQPVPPTPVPTPVDPGTIVPQTSDSASYAFAIFAMMAMLSAGILAVRKLYVK